MPTALYKSTLTTNEQARHLFMPQAAPYIQSLARKPADGVYNAQSGELQIFIEWQDFAARYPGLAAFARMKGTSSLSAPMYEQDYGTEALKIRRRLTLENARDDLRGIRLPPTGPNDPANNTGITPQMDAPTANRSIMQQSGGFCQGRDHGQEGPLNALTKGIDDGSLLNGGGLLFIEELPSALQEMVDTWLDDQNATMPEPLAAALAQQDVRCGFEQDGTPKTPFKNLLLKAKERGIRVFGIDGGDGAGGVDNASAGQPERRDVKMNALAKKVIDNARNRYPNLPMIASVGEAHMNHHEGGIPGIAQIMGVPGVTTDPNGKMVPVPDDPTKRGMPSRAAQAFIDGYIEQMEAKITGSMRDALSTPDKEAFKLDIYQNAKKLAQRLEADGTITDAQSVKDLLENIAKPVHELQNHPHEMIATQRDDYAELVQMWPNKGTNPDGVARAAIRAGSPGRLDKVLIDHPTTLNKQDGDGRSLMHWAAMLGHGDMIDNLAGRGGRVDLLDSSGNQPLQAAVKRRRDLPDPRVGMQGDAVGALVRNNADVNFKGEGGRTAMHWAALNNNTSALPNLGNNARMDIPDARGWTAHDTAVGSTKVEAEKWFYTKGKTNPLGVDPNTQPMDTVQALMKSIKCENPGKHQQQIEDALKELYGNPDLRPALDLLAKNSLLPRDADGGGGIKIFIADKDNVGMLYNSKTGKGPCGAYDENAHVVHVAGDGARDLAGELCHELTHAATRVAFDDKADVPFQDDNEKKEFVRAIQEDVKLMSLIMPGNAVERDIKEIISERMATTVRDYPDDAENKLMQEFAVSIPQLIAQYGSEEVGKLAPGLMKYYRGTFAQACKTAGNGPKYTQINAKIDNTNLANTARPRVPKKANWVPSGRDTAGAAIDMLKASYRAMHGKPKNLPNGVTTPYLVDQYELDTGEEIQFLLQMQKVEKALRKALKQEGMPPRLSADAMRSLALELGQEMKKGKPLKDLAKAVEGRVTTWARDSKVSYVEHCIKEQAPISDQALAEATIIRAETLAWMQGARDDEEYVAVEIDKSKHKAMVSELTKTLGKPSSANAKLNPQNLMDTLSRQMIGDKNRGFYRKVDKKGSKVTEHVSISKKDAKQTWLANL
jgi:ankyrin repeat protein